MKTNLSKVGAVLTTAILIIINFSLVSCAPMQTRVVRADGMQSGGGGYMPYPSQQYGASASYGCAQRPSMNPPSQRYGVQQNCPTGRPNMGGPQVPSNMPGRRQGDWHLGSVLHERWYYDATTGKTTKVGEEVLQPGADLDAKMRADGLNPFPNRVPVGGQLPTGRADGKHRPGQAPPLGGVGTPLPPAEDPVLEPSSSSLKKLPPPRVESSDDDRRGWKDA